MAAVFNCLGPIDLYIKQRVAGTVPASWSYLGTCEHSPEVEIQDFYNDVFNDLGGRQVPTCTVYDGERHNVSATVNRFDYSVYKTLISRVPPPVLINAGEAMTRGRVYTGFDDALFLMTHSFKGVTGVDDGNMPAGRMYYGCKFVSARESSVGTRVATISLLLQMDPVPILPAAGRPISFALFTENPALWGTVTPN